VASGAPIDGSRIALSDCSDVRTRFRLRLQDYLDRIGFAGTPRVDLEHAPCSPSRTSTRGARSRTWTCSFAVRSSLEIEPNYAKVVERRRGGWCYELNCVMGWALREIGFDVMRMSAGVIARQGRRFQSR
jgi:N-hydroxyarylamine O-acetyltransferase